MKKNLLVLFAFLLPGPGSAATDATCWEITDKNNETMVVVDIWHVKNRLGGGGVLVGELNGEEASVAVSEINSLTLAPAKHGLLSFVSADTMQGDIAFTNGNTGKFRSDHSLMYLKNGSRNSMPLADVRTISRCNRQAARELVASEQAGADEAAPARQVVPADVDSVVLDNGDLLTGTLSIDTIHWQAPYAGLTFTSGQVASMTLQRDEAGTGLIELRSGDRISGTLENTSVEMTLGYGQRIPLATDKIRSIHFRQPPE